MIKVDLIAGARPNFMKIAPIVHAVNKARKEGKDISYRIIHTGQHYDRNMSGNFFEELNIPDPDINLGAGSGTQAEITAAIMIGYEKVLVENKPDLCIVVGDVTSTMACSITAQKMQVKVAHVEGGIRSGDWSMPEEINRMVTDSISNYYFTTSEIANKNLLNLGINQNQIFFVGNTMIDTLLSNFSRLKKPSIWEKAGLKEKNYIVLTLHRPSNVDEGTKLTTLLQEIINSSNGFPVIFPVHPRTARIIDTILNSSSSSVRSRKSIAHNLNMIEPLGYLEFNFLVKHSLAVITDSGGITEETTVMGVPCITLRDSTERPETITIGTNELIGTDPKAINQAMKKLVSGNWKKGEIPPLWDGKAAERIVDIILNIGF